MHRGGRGPRDRKSTRLNSSHTVIYTLSLHDALPISSASTTHCSSVKLAPRSCRVYLRLQASHASRRSRPTRSEEHTSELQSHSDLHSVPTRRSSDLVGVDHPLQLCEAGAEVLSRLPPPSGLPCIEAVEAH